MKETKEVHADGLMVSLDNPTAAYELKGRMAELSDQIAFLEEELEKEKRNND